MPNPKDFKLLRQNTQTKICESHVKDDIDLLQNIPEQICSNSILALFDVASLYSNISHAVKFWFSLRRIPQEFILEPLTFILENNYFIFNNKPYKQIKGTVVETKAVPTYANLVMGNWEIELYKQVTKIQLDADIGYFN